MGKLGEKTYHQCAGFLRIQGGKNPLDSTSVHPESYEATEKLLKELGIDKKEILAGGVVDIEERLKDKWPDSLEALGKAIEVGLPTLRDIMAEIKKPGRDPREEAQGRQVLRQARLPRSRVPKAPSRGASVGGQAARAPRNDGSYLRVRAALQDPDQRT